MKIIKRFETFHVDYVLNEAEVKQDIEDTIHAIDDLANDLKKDGKQINSKEVGFDVLDKLLDRDFDLNKVTKDVIKEKYHYLLKEELSLDTVETVIHRIEELELIQNLTNKYGDKANKWLKPALEWVKKIIHLPFELLQKLAAWLARACGSTFEVSETTGLVSLGALSLVGIIYGIIHFPAVASIVAGGFSILALIKLISAILKGASGFYTLFKKWFKISKEVENKKMTINDLLDLIEPDYKNKYRKQIPFNYKTRLDEWCHHEKEKEDFIHNLTIRIKKAKESEKPKWSSSQMRQITAKLQNKIQDKEVLNILTNLLKTYY